MKEKKRFLLIFLKIVLFSCLFLKCATPPAESVELNFPQTTPASQGLSPEALNQLAKIVKNYAQQDFIVGAELLVIKNRKTVLHETVGWLDREQDLKMQKNTIFNIRSMTKPLTGAGIQLLIDQGKLKLEDRVAQFLPGFDNEKSDSITIFQLLTHQSGLPLTVAVGFANLEKFKNLQEMANAVGKRGPQFPPGSKFWYSDAATEVLGAIIEKISGMPLKDFISKNLFEALELHDTFYLIRTDSIKNNRIASLYGGSPGNWKKFWTNQDLPFYPFPFGSQSVYATPQDYARFLTLWMDNGKFQARQILSPEAISRTLTPVLPAKNLGADTPMPTAFPGFKVFYGQLAMLYVPQNSKKPVILGHTGSDGTFAWAWPERDLMILYFTQSRGQATGIRLEKEIDRLLINPGGNPEIAAVPEKYQPFIGKYRSKSRQLGSKTFEITTQNGNLALDIPGQMIFELNPPDTTGLWRLQMLPSAGVSFEQTGTEKAVAMIFSQSDEMRRENAPSETQKDLPVKFAGFPGTYKMPRGPASVKISWQNQTLNFAVPGQGTVKLVPTDKQDWFVLAKNKSAEISFNRDSANVVTSLNFHQKFYLVRE